MSRRRREKEKAWHRPQFFQLDLAPFEADLMVAVNLSDREFVTALRRRRTTETAIVKIMEAVGDWHGDTSVHGRAVHIQGLGYAVLLTLNPDRFRSAVGIIVHEMVHVAQLLLRARGVPATPDTDEVQAYLVSHLVAETLRRMY